MITFGSRKRYNVADTGGAAMPTVTVIQPKAADNEQRLLRIAAYCRVSSSSDDQLNSYNSQLTYYTHKFEDSETETLIDIYADEGITGTCEEKRTEFLRLIDDCRKGKIDRMRKSFSSKRMQG